MSKIKKVIKAIEKVSETLPEKQGPKNIVEKMPKGYSEFGYDIDTKDKKPFLYGVKKFNKDTIGHGAIKGKKDYIGSIEGKNFKGSYERRSQGEDILTGSYKKDSFEAGASKVGKDKQFFLKFKKKFSTGGIAIGKGKKYIKDLL